MDDCGTGPERRCNVSYLCQLFIRRARFTSVFSVNREAILALRRKCDGNSN